MVQVNHFKADQSGWIGSIIMLAFAVIAMIKFNQSGLIFFLMLFLRDIFAAWFLMTREVSQDKSTNKFHELLAYASSAFPFLYVQQADLSLSAIKISSIMAIIGFMVSTLALFELGTSFGVSPTKRSIKNGGLYRYFRHPMYLGYVIAESGFMLLAPINIGLFALSVAMYWVRAKIENKILD